MWVVEWGRDLKGVGSYVSGGGWPSVLVLIQIKMQMWGQMYRDAPLPPANLLVLISQRADGAAETLSATDVAADASNYLTIPSPPNQEKNLPKKWVELIQF